MSGTDYYASGRQSRNERSRDKASRHNTPWTSMDEKYLTKHWVDVPAEDRSESEVARKLGRTIESCRVRAEIIRGVRPQNGGGERNMDDITRQTSKPYLGKVNDDDPCAQWYA